MLHGGHQLPAGATWQQLIAGATVRRLRDAANASHAPGGVGVASWNICWAVDIDSERVRAKKATVEALLSRET
eukprot:11163167-Lingulodinium_polyedra.AAC.1